MNRVVHFELTAEDKEKSKAFYAKTFNWTFEVFPGFDYHLIYTGKEGAGIDGGYGSPEDFEQKVVLTIDVKDIDQAITDVEANGGIITVPKTEIQGVGYLAYFKDPTGITMGLMESFSADE